MPPKGTKKVVIDAPPSTPVKGEDGEDTAETPATTEGKPKRKPRIKAPEKVFGHLSSNVGDAVPVDVSFEGETTHSKPHLAGGYIHFVRLHAPQSFELKSSVMLEDGSQAMIIKPSKPFPFLKLPVCIRQQIYRLLFAPENGKDRIEFTTSSSGDVVAKEYAKESKKRLAILQVNKEILDEGRLILYGYRLRFDNTTTIVNFLTTNRPEISKAVTQITIVTCQKATTKSAFSLMSGFCNLTKLAIMNGIGVNTAPEKAAKSLFSDASLLLQNLVQAKGGDKEAAIAVLTFGKNCLTLKGDDDQAVNWSEDEMGQFSQALMDKLK